MGLAIGLILIGLALFVGIGMMLVANRSVREFKDDEHIRFSRS